MPKLLHGTRHARTVDPLARPISATKMSDEQWIAELIAESASTDTINTDVVFGDTTEELLFGLSFDEFPFVPIEQQNSHLRPEVVLNSDDCAMAVATITEMCKDLFLSNEMRGRSVVDKLKFLIKTYSVERLMHYIRHELTKVHRRTALGLVFEVLQAMPEKAAELEAHTPAQHGWVFEKNEVITLLNEAFKNADKFAAVEMKMQTSQLKSWLFAAVAQRLCSAPLIGSKWCKLMMFMLMYNDGQYCATVATTLRSEILAWDVIHQNDKHGHPIVNFVTGKWAVLPGTIPQEEWHEWRLVWVKEGRRSIYKIVRRAFAQAYKMWSQESSEFNHSFISPFFGPQVSKLS